MAVNSRCDFFSNFRTGREDIDGENMIVSASYRTDIPAFYGDWFHKRLEIGHVTVKNPYGGAYYRISLEKDAVSGFVFWTKHAGPFLKALEEVSQRGFPFVVQHTITGYPAILERSAPAPDTAITGLRKIARRYGTRVAVWRYDPIVLTDRTGFAWHEANFTRLARKLSSITDEVVVSFAQIYRKTERNLDIASKQGGFTWFDPPIEQKQAFLIKLADIAASHGMALKLCSQPEIVPPGQEDALAARCIDTERLSDVAGSPIKARRKGNRPGCLCAESRDIGAYDSCPMGCVYCYAVSDRRRAQERYRNRERDDAL